MMKQSWIGPTGTALVLLCGPCAVASAETIKASVRADIAALMAIETVEELVQCDEKAGDVLLATYRQQLRAGGGVDFDDAKVDNLLFRETFQLLRDRWEALEQTKRRLFTGKTLEDGIVVRPLERSGKAPHPSGGAEAPSTAEPTVSLIILADGSEYEVELSQEWYEYWKTRGYDAASGWEALVPVTALRANWLSALAEMGIGEVTVCWRSGREGVSDAGLRKLVERAKNAKKQGLPEELSTRWAVRRGVYLAKRHWALFERDYDEKRLDELLVSERREMERWNDEEDRAERLRALFHKLQSAYFPFSSRRNRGRERALLREVSQRPGVVSLPRGVLCVVEKGEESVENIDSGAVVDGFPPGTSFQEGGVSHTMLPDFIASELRGLPRGKSWTFFIPGSAFVWKPEQQVREEREREERERLLDELVPAQRKHRRETRSKDDSPEDGASARPMTIIKFWKNA